MREILFRAKRLDNGEWIHGDLKHGGYYDRDDMYIGVTLGQTVITYPVIPETVGQYTGLTDKNGTKIFEGDLVLAKYSDSVGKDIECRVLLTDMTDFEVMWRTDTANEIEVIGNIHDNKELLGGE